MSLTVPSLPIVWSDCYKYKNSVLSATVYDRGSSYGPAVMLGNSQSMVTLASLLKDPRAELKDAARFQVLDDALYREI